MGGGGGGGFGLLGIQGTSVFAAIDSRTNKIVWKKEMGPGMLGGSGPLTTAGGLLFRGAGDGNFQAYDAKTGDLLWQFQTGMPGRGPAATYELDGEQYVALVVGPEVLAFKLGGTLAQRPARQAGSGAGGGGGGGPIENTAEIETASLATSVVLTAGHKYAVDEFTFKPTRARVRVGTRVTWINNGRMVHTLTAQDGSWTTGPMNPGQEGYVSFDKPGTFMYSCKEHPWSLGQIIVEP
jgi:plastocyanin